MQASQKTIQKVSIMIRIIIVFTTLFLAYPIALADDSKVQATFDQIYGSSNIKDNRISLGFSEEERTILLSEMRVILTSIQQILAATAANDKDLLLRSAEHSGASLASVLEKVRSKSYNDKTTLAFEKIGAASRMRFDQFRIAVSKMDISNSDNLREINSMISKLMKNCLVCHAVYRY